MNSNYLWWKNKKRKQGRLMQVTFICLVPQCFHKLKHVFPSTIEIRFINVPTKANPNSN